MTQDDAAHLDLEQLADVLAAEDSADVAAHAAGCPECRARLEQLQAAMGPVTSALTGLPRPDLPADVGERLHRAILREQVALHPPAGAAAGGRTPADRRSRPRLTALGPLLAGLAVLAVVVLLLVRGGGGTKDPQPTPTRTASGEVRTSSTGTDYEKSGSRLQVLLPSLLSGQAPDAFPTPSPDPLARLRLTPALASCLAGLSEATEPVPGQPSPPGADGLPLALDYARFEGQPALVVVLPAANPDKLDVFFVGPMCSQGDEQVLHFARVDRPGP